MVLKQGVGAEDESGSFVESESLKQVERCHAINKLAGRLRF
jgi:hypothetical protein